MKIQEIFKRDIDRNIDGVIKVDATDDESLIEQELSEYVVTRELGTHFNTLLSRYLKSFEEPTDKVGVWISGFFGSGKSHFLKILSYLFSNRLVAGKHAVEYFEDKFRDPWTYTMLENCVKAPTETILFNIDSKAPASSAKDESVLPKIFARVFYDHQGYFGSDLKVARIEQYISEKGKFEEFQETFHEITGDSWEQSRETLYFVARETAQAMARTLNMDEEAAYKWIDDVEQQVQLSIDGLVREIKRYVDSKGKNFRLIFMVDEVGQYISERSSLMLNLQTFVEELGTRCGGKVWVMVTAQEAIDRITKIKGGDFSKIQGRFDTRISLSSKSVDEVIKTRILEKTDNARSKLKLVYEENEQELHNLITFGAAAASDMKGFLNAEDFAASYPFVPYQFRLMQNVFTGVRKHSTTGKNLSEGERSMLSSFQDAARAIEDKDETALVPFQSFFDTINKSLDSAVSRVVARCADAAESGDGGLIPFDTEVLKLLYLVRYVDDVSATPDTITVLMCDSIHTDKIALGRAVKDSLDRLLRQNYIAKGGAGTYSFLTDEEQDIWREIRATPVDSAMITDKISEIIFDKIYTARKFRYGMQDFEFARKVDEVYRSQPNGAAMTLWFVTADSENHSDEDHLYLFQSSRQNAILVVLADKTSDGIPIQYYENLETALKIRSYAKGRNLSQCAENVRKIVEGCQAIATQSERDAERLISEAILNGRLYVAGDRHDEIKSRDVRERVDSAFVILIRNVYTKFDMLKKFCTGDVEIREILKDTGKQLGFDEEHDPNAEAQRQVEGYIQRQSDASLPISMASLQSYFQGPPFGWREIDIAALTARLVAATMIELRVSGAPISPTDPGFVDCLRKRGKTQNVSVRIHNAPPSELIENARVFLGNFFDCGKGAFPDREAALVEEITRRFESLRAALRRLLNERYARAAYPGKGEVENGVRLCDALLANRGDSIALLNALTVKMRDELTEGLAGFKPVWVFFAGEQVRVYDRARELSERIRGEEELFHETEPEAEEEITKLRGILEIPKPGAEKEIQAPDENGEPTVKTKYNFDEISLLPDLTEDIEAAYEALMKRLRAKVQSEIDSAQKETERLAEEVSRKDIHIAEGYEKLSKRVKDARTLTDLNAVLPAVAEKREALAEQLLTEPQSKEGGAEPQIRTVKVRPVEICPAASLKSEADIDAYTERVRQALLRKFEGHDALNIF